MNHADMLLGRSQIAGILEGDPGMAGLKQHGEHLAPEVGRPHVLKSASRRPWPGFIRHIGGLEIRAIEIVQIGRIVGENRVQSPSCATRCMNRSGTQLAVFMSWVRRRSSPVFLRRSRNSSMSRCQVSR